MKYLYLALLSLLFVTFTGVYAQDNLKLEIIHPKNNSTINAPSTFFIGNTDPKAKLKINGKTVKISPNGGFTHVVELKRGINKITIKATLNKKEKSLIYTIKVPEYEKTIPNSPLTIDQYSIKPNRNITYRAGDIIQVSFKGSTGNNATFSIGKQTDIPMIELPTKQSKTNPAFGKSFPASKEPIKGFYTGSYIIQDSDDFKNTPITITLASKDKSISKIATAKITSLPKDTVPTIGEVIRNNAIVRTAPEESRLTPLVKGIRLNITGKIGNDYRFKMGEAMQGWISASDVKILPAGTPIAQSDITSFSIESEPANTIIKIPLTQKLPVGIQQIPGPQMILNIYGANANIDLFPYNPKDNFIKEIKWVQPCVNTFQVIITPNSDQFWGYSYSYEDNTFVLKLRKTPITDAASPLKDKLITIDPGHGGQETGSVGPTGVPEKNINLAIAKFLKGELEEVGAKVIMTRENDVNVGLTERTEIAKKNDAQILLSIHNNALPDGRDPFTEHGSSTYYYHSQALPLAKSLQDAMLKNLGFNNYGIFWDSLALTRPNEPLSVLVEIGFMVNPDEYSKLIDPDFQKKSAKALKIGLENFFKSKISNQ